jgi:hypothetical protein
MSALDLLVLVGSSRASGRVDGRSRWQLHSSLRAGWLAACLVVVASACSGIAASPEPTNAPSVDVAQASASRSFTALPTELPSMTPELTPTAAPTSTLTPTPEPTVRPTPRPTPVPTPIPWVNLSEVIGSIDTPFAVYAGTTITFRIWALPAPATCSAAFTFPDASVVLLAKKTATYVGTTAGNANPYAVSWPVKIGISQVGEVTGTYSCSYLGIERFNGTWGWRVRPPT